MTLSASLDATTSATMPAELPAVDQTTRNAPSGSARGQAVDGSRRALADRFEAVGWGLLLVFIGALALPRGDVEFALVAGVGAAMVLLNVLRVAHGIAISWFGIILGTVAVVAGLGAMAGVSVPFVALVLVLLGVATIVGAAVRAD